MKITNVSNEYTVINERLIGFGKSNTLQLFGNDVIITDPKGRSISLSKKDSIELIKVLYNTFKVK